MTKWLSACVLVLGIAGCAANQEMEQRTRQYFHISQSQKVDAATIRAAILTDVSTGSPTVQVYAFLDQRGIGKDGLSSYQPLNAHGEIVCRIEFDPKAFQVVKRHLGIIFTMGPDGMLDDVQVKEWLTGL